MGVVDGDSRKCGVIVIDDGVNLIGSVMVVTGIMAAVLVLSGLFHSVLRRMGQPSVISHILLDLRYLRHNLRRSLAIACGGFSLCLVFAMLGGTYFYRLMNPGEFPDDPDRLRDSTALLALVLTSTASPVLIRIVTELKLAGSEIGQLAIGAAFANDMASLAALSFVMVRSFVFGDAVPFPALRAVVLAAMALSLWAAIGVASWAARLLNRVNRGRRHISSYELCGLLLLVTGLAEVERVVGYSNVIGGFLMGLAMPREGPTARTVLDRLAYPMHQLIMPLCFASIGARLDFARVQGWRLARAVAFATALSAAGNVCGTVVAGRALVGLAAGEAVVLGFLLNVKGYADVMAINFGDKAGVWRETAQAVLLLSSILNTFMAGPPPPPSSASSAASWVPPAPPAGRRRGPPPPQRGRLRARRGWGPRHARRRGPRRRRRERAAAAPRGAGRVEQVHHHAPPVPPRPRRRRRRRGGSGRLGKLAGDRPGGGRGGVLGTPGGAAEHGGVEPRRPWTPTCATPPRSRAASLVVVPCHRDLRYDGRLVCRREGRRGLNHRVLHRAPPPCTVGVLAERRRSSSPDHRVAALFLGGPDDREAAAYAARVAARGVATDGVTLCRMVVTGQVEYTERHVAGGAEMVDALRDVARAYSLVVVGRSGGSAGAQAMARGMGDWLGDEFLELGPVGEVLASDDFRDGGSVLVLQQHKTKTRKQDQPTTQQQSTPPPCPC
ncbi:hypothetical protein PR202_ga06999 [Eleusine coracana subsp. coracana]|uniref:Cation/H+ exchanger transmembrane domain-containing protein n=1 Tax=Eleusine coracana subsp. coracana TaxID=191504 RepID=A0AAV5BYI2_ELECO|nr:hypothetical protein PR202_ga06999 [Eleusine coracana subsp. coracana]